MIKGYENISLKKYNTFGIDVRCRKFMEFETEQDLRDLFSSEGFKDSAWSVISGGSNIVFTKDYDGVLLHPVSNDIRIISDDGNSVLVNAAAGVVWDEFVAFCATNGLWGTENLSYIPGYAGASPVQNIGAYGVEAKDIIESVEMFCVDSLSRLKLTKEHCGFGYRNSVFKNTLKGRVIITSVNFMLSRIPAPKLGYGDLNNKVESLGGPSLENIRRAVIEIRRSKLPEPEELGNAGSFFKNPVVPQEKAVGLKEKYSSMPLYPAQEEGCAKLAAGWLVEQAGWKGRRIGDAGVHERQALVLVNYGKASGKDIMDLAGKIKDEVYGKFGVVIEPEVNVL